MPYELETFHQIVSGELHPARQPKEATSAQLTSLRQHQDRLTIQYLIRFTKPKNGHSSLISYRPFGALISEAHLFLHSLSAEDNPDQLSRLQKLFIQASGVSESTVSQSALFASPTHYHLSILLSRDFASLSPEEIRYWYYDHLLAQEIEQFKRCFHERVFSLESEEKIRLYVQNHQSQLETFTDIVLEQLSREEQKRVHQISGEYTLTDVYKLIYQHLEIALAHIERHFMKYLDLTNRAPYRSKILFSEALRTKVDFIDDRIGGSSINPALREILTKPLSKLSDIQDEEEFTYHELFYFQKFLREFYRALSLENEEITDGIITETLYQTNYNATDFVKYLSDQIREEADQHESMMDKLEVLYRHLKEYNQHHCKVNVPCYGHRSIQEQMIGWLDEEIGYLTKVMEAKIKQNAARTFAKIETPLSVSAVIYFLRLQKKVGMISNRHHADVMRCMAENVSTQRKKDITLHSIERKYYNVEDSTKQKLRDYLQQIIDLIDKSFKTGD
ncbi:hypothetical protein [Tunicatimonas pelagia]|uniref:hypothetical protein n=1 Tax=Tunicatimonas pelagia TaxID=931531 RepID=UPI002665138D|nr:hypothetical protein [Tunicatimonas pelagia]WKN44894.1 hypothetical protein P0M28_07955 [Tunicatimonas pelagia]